MNMLTVLLGLGAALQTIWLLIYGTGPWRDTPIGWVWLLKGVAIATLLWLIVYDRAIADLSTRTWIAGMVVFDVAVLIWVITTALVRSGRSFTDL